MGNITRGHSGGICTGAVWKKYNTWAPYHPTNGQIVADRRLRVFVDHFGYFGCNIVPSVSLWWWVVQGGYFGYKIGQLH